MSLIEICVEATSYGSYRATSNGPFHVHLVSPSIPELHQGIREALTEILAAKGKSASVYPEGSGLHVGSQNWVIDLTPNNAVT